MIYLVCFAASVFLAYLASKTDDRKHFWIYSVASVSIMVLLAGLRDFSIGIDVMGYYTKTRYWNGAIQAESLASYMQNYLRSEFSEPLFALLVGCIAKSTGNYHVFLFTVHTIIISCVYIGAFRQKKYVNPAFVLLIFYLFFFNHSLNIMRQYIAMAILFAAFADIQEKKYLRYCGAVLLAICFHTTAILGLGVLVLHFLMYFEHSKLEKLTFFHRKAIIGGVLALMVLSFSPLVKLAMKIGLLNDRYIFFLKDDAVSPAAIISAIVLLGLAAAYYYKDTMRKQCEHYDFFVMCSVAYVILLQLTWFVAFGKRIAFYFALPDLLTIGMIEKAQEGKSKKTQWIVRGAIVGVALIYWCYVYALRNASETIPYQFFF